jgi:alpha-L-rhamnosidase
LCAARAIARGGGYDTVRLAPTPGPGLDWANAALETKHGRIECGCDRVPQSYRVTNLVPSGVTATIELPDRTIRPVPTVRSTFVSR